MVCLLTGVHAAVTPTQVRHRDPPLKPKAFPYITEVTKEVGSAGTSAVTTATDVRGRTVRYWTNFLSFSWKFKKLKQCQLANTLASSSGDNSSI